MVDFSEKLCVFLSVYEKERYRQCVYMQRVVYVRESICQTVSLRVKS